MRNHRRGATRLISAVLSFALVIAHVVGAYAHAAGHNHAEEHAACAHQDIPTPLIAAAESGVHEEAGHCSEPSNHLDAVDFMCHGGLAVLTVPGLHYIHAKSPQASTVPEIIHLLLAASLERPPRSAVRA